jgi:NitT/TauT family transport system substrate-binding protein
MATSLRHGARAGFIAYLIAGLALAGCGGGDDGGSGSGSQERVTLDVAAIPIGNIAPMYLGDEKGFFRDEGISLKPKLVQSGNDVITSMVSGSAEIGFAGYVPAMVARSRNVPVKVVANADNGAATEKDEWTKVVVPGDSDIRTVGDLAGKTIATNSLKGVGEVVVKASLEKQGVDPSSIKLIEVGFPEMPATLEAKRVDAAWVTEPFLSQVLAREARAVDAPLTTLGREYANAAYLTTDEYLEENPEVVERFVRAMNRSLDYARAHPDEARKVIPTFTQIPPAAAKQIVLPLWLSEIDKGQVEELAEHGKKYGVTGDVNVDELVWEGAKVK